MTIHVGLIGYGLSGAIFHAPLIQSVEGLHIKTIVSSNPDKVHQDLPHAAVVTDPDMMLSDPDIDLVVVTSPNTTHYDLAMRAIHSGKHVVVEKPFTITSAEAEQLIELAQSKNVLLSVYQNRRWDNDFLTIKKMLATRLLGQLTTFESHYDRYRPTVQERWREKNLPGSGMLYDLGAHLIDQALHLFGKPLQVWADLRNERQGAQVTDYFHIIFAYQNFRVILHSGSLVMQPGPRFTLHGDKGSFIKAGMDPQEEQLKQGLRPGDRGWGQEDSTQYGRLRTTVEGLVLDAVVETVPGKYEAFYQGMVEAIRDGKAVPVPAEEALETIRMIEFAIQSAEEQRMIKIV